MLRLGLVGLGLVLALGLGRVRMPVSKPTVATYTSTCSIYTAYMKTRAAPE